jgi:hypothetical protein
VAGRFYVVGIPGSGKTSVSRTIAQRLGIAHVELDALFHGPNWSLPPAGEFERRVAAELDGLDDWVVDGNYRSRVGGHVLERATTIVWLDLPLRVCLDASGVAPGGGSARARSSGTRRTGRHSATRSSRATRFSSGR